MSAFDPSSNSWQSMPDMQVKRGRFDAATSLSSNGQTSIYAVAGSLGQMETNTAERYDPDTGKWTHIASLPAAISSNGERDFKVLLGSD